MLGKLLKYEFKDIYKKMILFYGVAFLTAIITGITFLFAHHENFVFGMISGLATMMFFVAMAALIFMSYIVVILRFYKTMFSSQGYLTHTLPVSPMQLYFSKLIAGMAAVITTLVCAYLCGELVFQFFINSESGAFVGENSLVEVVVEFFNIIFAYATEYIFHLFLSMVIGLFTFLIMVYSAICIGQKVGMSILAYIALNFIIQFISSIVIIVPMVFIYGTEYLTDVALVDAQITTFTLSNILSVVIMVALIFISRYKITKKLNLE